MSALVSRLGIVGAGQMGAGIAQVAALNGIEVLLNDISVDQLEKANQGIARRLGRLVEKGRISPDAQSSAYANITTVAELGDLSACDLVVEAVSEKRDLKVKVLCAIREVIAADAVLATNTSSISITELGAAAGCADRFIGMHFMNPVPMMKLVEVIRGLETSDATWETTRALGERMGKTVVVSRDFSGFIVNRILIPMLNEAIYALMEGVASAVDIDAAMKLGTNQPMGPLTLADFIGLDTVLSIAEVLHEGLGDPKYRPCPLLKQYVAAGRLGKKSGRGFFEY